MLFIRENYSNRLLKGFKSCVELNSRVSKQATVDNLVKIFSGTKTFFRLSVELIPNIYIPLEKSRLDLSRDEVWTPYVTLGILCTVLCL